MRAYKLNSWVTPASSYPVARCGRARLAGTYYSSGYYKCYDQKAPDGQRYGFYEATKRLRICTLSVAGQTVMVDDPPHWWTILGYAAEFSGHVLVAGLGLGLIVHALSQNPKVQAITVVEREPDVIELLGPLIPSNHVNIVEADWYDYEPSAIVDGVFFDLFVGDGIELLSAALRTMMDLRRRFPGAISRILGFNNHSLISNVDLILEGSRDASLISQRG